MTIKESRVNDGYRSGKPHAPAPTAQTRAPEMRSKGAISSGKILGWLWLLPFLALAPPASADLITNGSFETVTPALITNGICRTATSGYPYGVCSATGWTGNYQIGNGSTVGIFGVSFGIPQPDPDGSNALILQTSSTVASAATQSISIPVDGLYTLTFDVANRSFPAGNNGPQTVGILLDGTPLAGGTYASLPVAWTLETLNFSASAGMHSLTLESPVAPPGAGTDVSAFIDKVSLLPEAASAPEPSSWALVAIALIALGTRMRSSRNTSPDKR